MFLARVERLPVTSRSHVTDITDVTDKCKISIMINIFYTVRGTTPAACACRQQIKSKVTSLKIPVAFPSLLTSASDYTLDAAVA